MHAPESPQRSASGSDRYTAVARVLVHVLVLNLAVALAKIVFGYTSGAISILSDGFHSLTDAASNVAGLVGVHAARQPPDEDHPYGHRKYETVAAAAVTVFLLLLVIEVIRNAVNHLTGRTQPHEISAASFVVMLVTIAVNLAVVAYESRAAERLGSEVLLADATQTRGDVWSSLTVIGALVGARLGLPILDPIAALVVAGFIGYAGFEVARATTGILSDRIVISDADLKRVVMSVPGVIGCEKIRTRGSADHVFLDLHVWMPSEMRLMEAHDLSHVVKDRLMARYPQIADAVIHIEPPPATVAMQNANAIAMPLRIADGAMTIGDWDDRFDAMVERRTRQANAATIAPFVTERDQSGDQFAAIGNGWSRSMFGGLFYVSPSASNDLPAANLVFVQSRDGNTVTADPSVLGGGEADRHLIYEGLSRVACDAVLAGARTIGAAISSCRSGGRSSSRFAPRWICRGTRRR